MIHEFNAQLSKLNRRMSALVADLNTLHQQRAEATTEEQKSDYNTEIYSKLYDVEATANEITELAYTIHTSL